MKFNTTRRRLLEIAAGATVFGGASRFARGAESASEIPRRRLGHTGEMVSTVGLGGYHLVRPTLDETESVRIVRTAIDRESTFSTTAGTTMAGRARFAWAKRCATAIDSASS